MENVHGLAHERRRHELQSCRLIEGICFAAFLPVACLARLGGWRWQPWPPQDNHRHGSVLSEARSMARNVASMAISTP